MKQLIKLKDLTSEQWDKHRNALCNIDKRESCDGCIFQGVNCSDSLFRNSWINNKEKYNDNFLNQEVELHSILEEKEKEYLRAIITPFREHVRFFTKQKYNPDIHCIAIMIELTDHIPDIIIPVFENENSEYAFAGMEWAKAYLPTELGL